ncbi:MAG: Asp-tRNA(Asn)/Glu-tRNA(Gln) amidotransferase subunit GatA [Calditrichaceae bacterium]|nr:Asp-tRNA(Asn)/Glu-tRNA(Gln) amidotransferase subunit GatA [Calditrichaceae bacterium]MBN2709379.1 Asp-tRNA(Asn)/Glu-tRNA(Gln) amidotransferase subunit GatA [Calditrichaceae bacterium]RQV95752.1 MAG: Asp-tRNA(Asn)/Glu-tRNA(Gln) amidotransferase subunit GatA [Calditrichota bacterium]
MNLQATIAAVKKGEVKAEERVNKFLQVIQSTKEFNAYIKINDKQAKAKAVSVDHRIKDGRKTGKLAGCVVAIKDNINIKDQETTCASNILKGFISPYSATVIEKLEQEDAIIIGKTNHDEFAMGSSDENSCFGPVKNPHDPKRVPGGSSGGSAVAVALDTVDVALGSETGGSVRQPAGLTGITGLKPSYGRVSRYGLVAFASSLDQISPFAKDTADLAVLFNVIAGHDERDSTSAEIEVPDYSAYLNKDVKGMKIGIPKEYFADGLDGEIRDGILQIVEQLKAAGAEIRDVELPLSEYGVAAYYILATAEASSNLARYDGVRYGHRNKDKAGLTEMYAQTRNEGFGDEVKRRILLGTYVLSHGYYDAYYKKAQKVRRLIKNEFDSVFSEVDALITPTTPTTAFLIGERADDPLQMYLSDVYTVTANLGGICALNVRAGKDKNKLPFGLQIMANQFKEEILFQIGDFIDRKCTRYQWE